MRRLIALAALFAAACAQPGFPPGGPEEKVPPKLLSLKPDSGAVNVHPEEVSLQFDEVLKALKAPTREATQQTLGELATAYEKPLSLTEDSTASSY